MISIFCIQNYICKSKSLVDYLVKDINGNKTQLNLLNQLAQKQQISLTIILEIIHVIEDLWKAAFIFHSPSSPQAENWVSESWLRILLLPQETVLTETQY